MELKNVTQQNVLSELRELLPGYLSRREDDVMALKSFAAHRDFGSIKLLGHKLKGNGSSFGFDRISEVGALLMRAGEEQNVSEVLQLTTEIQNIIANAKSQLFPNLRNAGD